MAAKMILKDAKAPLHLLRSSVLSAVRSKTAPSNDEFVQALRSATQKPISEAADLRGHLCNDCSLKSQAVIGVEQIWAAINSGIALEARQSKRVVDDDDDDYSDNDFVDSRDDDDYKEGLYDDFIAGSDDEISDDD
ncbi:hypothetical protein L484_002928 [Morus notabilis]|uniref:Uncharacterized protein n=1 Tax=Morus notabilis TaxID=981085 RepID=W9QR46_9ROSA|nr:hypothetical protein L484_002928 [Morus notabilis]